VRGRMGASRLYDAGERWDVVNTSRCRVLQVMATTGSRSTSWGACRTTACGRPVRTREGWILTRLGHGELRRRLTWLPHPDDTPDVRCRSRKAEPLPHEQRTREQQLVAHRRAQRRWSGRGAEYGSTGTPLVASPMTRARSIRRHVVSSRRHFGTTWEVVESRRSPPSDPEKQKTAGGPPA